MAYFEGEAFCTRKEYIEGRESRVMPTDLQMDELYIMMLALTATEPEKQAAKKLNRVIEIEKASSGAYLVKFTFLDNDLYPQLTTIGKIEEGYWTDTLGNIALGGDLPIVEGYFKTYRDEWDDGLQQINTSLDLSRTALGGMRGH
jgi:hypothetical protein